MITQSTLEQRQALLLAVAALEPSVEGCQDYQVKTLSVNGQTLVSISVADIRATAAYVNKLSEGKSE